MKPNVFIFILMAVVGGQDAPIPPPFNVDLNFSLAIEPLNGASSKPLQFSTVAVHHSSRIFIGAAAFRTKENFIAGTVFECQFGGQPPCRQLQPLNGSRIVQNGQLADYPYQARNKSLFGHTVHVEPDGTVLVCAPNWVSPVLDAPEGVCFVFDVSGGGPAEQRFVFKFRTSELTRHNRPKESHTLFGFSMADNRAGRLLFGLPGYYDFCGTWVELDTDGGRFLQMAFEDRNRSRSNSYTGYSVAYYGPETILVATPRLTNFRGKVELINAGDRTVLLTFHSADDAQGEFFGSSILVADTENDAEPEILIGAPFYSVGRLPRLREIGRVYLFRNIKQSLQQGRADQPEIIVADIRKPGARFGTHLAAIDLNLDQCEDVVIGAPFEENGDGSSSGAIYIYYGSPGAGLMTGGGHPRRIGVEAIWPTHIQGFGFTFWTGTDLDGNGYPDLVVANLQAKAGAFVLLTKPIVYMAATVSFHPAAINFSDTSSECVPGHFCFNVSYCIVLQSPLFEFARHPLRLAIQMTVPDRNLVLKEDRVMPPSAGHPSWNRTVQTMSDKVCRPDNSFTVVLKRKEDIFDIITPIEIQLAVQLSPPQNHSSGIRFCPVCPVADPVTVTNEIGFEHGCAHQLCLSRLVLEVEIKYGPEAATGADRLVEGQANVLDVVTTIRNEGESSINTNLVVASEPALPLVPGPDSSRCALESPEHRAGPYRCEISKLMVTDQRERMVIRLDLAGIDSKHLWLLLNATTSSQIADGSRLHYSKNFTITKQADFSIRLKTLETQHNFTHLVQRVLFPVSILVEKTGPSTVAGAFIQFEVPPVIEIEQPLQYGCTKVKQGPKRFTKVDIVNETLQMTCPSEQCSRYRCDVGRFEPGTAVIRPTNLDITLSFKAFRINENIKYRVARLETPFRLYLNDSFFDPTVVADEIVPLFVFYKLDSDHLGSLPHQNLIMFGSAGLGILIIILTTIILIKNGFFKRRKSDHLKKMHQRISMAPNMFPLPITDEGTEINQIGFS